MENNLDFAEKVTQLCLEHYEKLPRTGKPNDKEWTILSAIVLVQSPTSSSPTSCEPTLTVVSMGTGSKCIGQGKLSPRGDIINDSHAEIMARRGLLRYLYDQVRNTITGRDSIFSFNNGLKLCELKPGTEFVFFCSHTPCGDASIIPFNSDSDLVQPANIICNDSELDEPNAKKARLESDIHRTGAKCIVGEPQDPVQPERKEDFHVTGVLRTKPGRGDRTLSMSCSDKLAKWNILGWQGALLMHFLVSPIYVSTMVLGSCPFDRVAMERALWQRLKNLDGLPAPFESSFRPVILQSTRQFPHAKKKGVEKPAPGSIVWTLAASRSLEVAVEGKKQGATKKSQLTSQGRLTICKKNLFQTFESVLKSVPEDRLPTQLRQMQKELDTVNYLECKSRSSSYQEAWRKLREGSLKNWTRKSPSLLEFGNSE